MDYLHHGLRMLYFNIIGLSFKSNINSLLFNYNSFFLLKIGYKFFEFPVEMGSMITSLQPVQLTKVFSLRLMPFLSMIANIKWHWKTEPLFQNNHSFMVDRKWKLPCGIFFYSSFYDIHLFFNPEFKLKYCAIEHR